MIVHDSAEAHESRAKITQRRRDECRGGQRVAGENGRGAE